MMGKLCIKPKDVQNVLANSILEFIWRIADRSICYTTDAYRRKLSLFQVPQARQSSFDDFVWALLDRNFEQVRRIANSVLFWQALLGE